MSNRQSVGNAAAIFIGVAASLLIAWLGGGLFLFTLPMLLIGRRFAKTSQYLLVQAATYIAVMAILLLPYKDVFSYQNLGMILFGAIFPFMSCLQALVYTGMRDRSNSILRKFVAASVPVFVTGCAFTMWLVSKAGKPAYDALNAVVESMFSQQVNGIDLSDVVPRLLPTVLRVMVPAGLITGGIPIMIAEVMQNWMDENWQYEIANMKMPGMYLWVLLIGLIAAVPAAFVETWPKALEFAGWNVTLGMCVHYLMNGFSVAVSFLSRRISRISIGRLFFIMVLLGIVPGINFAVLLGLVVTGILENWIKMR